MATLQIQKIDFIVVDDDPDIGSVLTSYFESRGHTALSLQESSKLLPWLELNTCAAIVLDIYMPGTDGLTLLQRIRSSYPRLPVVIFTGAGYHEEKLQAALRLGANGYVSKGLKVQEIYSALIRAIGWTERY
jgi:DNA-binding NtrC family response regulator